MSDIFKNRVYIYIYVAFVVSAQLCIEKKNLHMTKPSISRISHPNLLTHLALTDDDRLSHIRVQLSCVDFHDPVTQSQRKKVQISADLLGFQMSGSLDAVTIYRLEI